MKKNSKQQQSKSQQAKQQQAAGKQQTNQQPPKQQQAAGQPRTPFVQQLETDRKHLQESGEIGGVAGAGSGDKRSYVRLVGLDGELLEQVKLSTRPAAIEKYFRSWPQLRVVLESGGQTNWIRRLIAGLGHEVLVADARQLRLISQSCSKNDRNDAYWLPSWAAPTRPCWRRSSRGRFWSRWRGRLRR